MWLFPLEMVQSEGPIFAQMPQTTRIRIPLGTRVPLRVMDYRGTNVFIEHRTGLTLPAWRAARKNVRQSSAPPATTGEASESDTTDEAKPKKKRRRGRRGGRRRNKGTEGAVAVAQPETTPETEVKPDDQPVAEELSIELPASEPDPEPQPITLGKEADDDVSDEA
jgi:hypothetical protein